MSSSSLDAHILTVPILVRRVDATLTEDQDGVFYLGTSIINDPAIPTTIQQVADNIDSDLESGVTPIFELRFCVDPGNIGRPSTSGSIFVDKYSSISIDDDQLLFDGFLSQKRERLGSLECTVCIGNDVRDNEYFSGVMLVHCPGNDSIKELIDNAAHILNVHHMLQCFEPYAYDGDLNRYIVGVVQETGARRISESLKKLLAASSTESA